MQIDAIRCLRSFPENSIDGPEILIERLAIV